MSATVKILEWKPRSSGALRRFADVEFPSGAIFHECAVFEQGGRWWAAPASKPQVSREGTVLKTIAVRQSMCLSFLSSIRRAAVCGQTPSSPLFMPRTQRRCHEQC
jgi:hypothetical protein